MAKHILLSTRILSKPRTCTRSRFAANMPITKRVVAAEHIEIAVGEISKRRTAKAARAVVSRVMRGCEIRRLLVANDVVEQSSPYGDQKDSKQIAPEIGSYA